MHLRNGRVKNGGKKEKKVHVLCCVCVCLCARAREVHASLPQTARIWFQ
jgi:hypothetical protein